MLLIDRLSHISHRLVFLKPFSIALSLGCLGFIFYSFIFTFTSMDVNSTHHSLALFVFIWSLLFNLFLSVFIHIPIDSVVHHKLSLFKRIKRSILVFLYFIFSLFFIGITVIILFLSLRMVRVWLAL